MPKYPPQTALVMVSDPLLRERLRSQLSRLGVAEVLFASSGLEALTTLSSELVDLILTRWELPDMEGIELLEALRARGRFGPVPVVLLDSGQSPAALIAAVKWGIAGCLDHPPRQSQLAALIQSIGDDLQQPRES